MIENAASECARVHAILAGIQGAPGKALSNAMNRALVTSRTQFTRGMAGAYYIKQKDITSNSKVYVKKASATKLQGYVSFAGTLIPLFDFRVRATKRKGVTAAVIRGQSAKRLESAYVADLGRYGPGVFERLTSKRATSQQLYGPSPAHMAENPEVSGKASEAAEEMFIKRAEHEIYRILNRYGR